MLRCGCGRVRLGVEGGLTLFLRKAHMERSQIVMYESENMSRGLRFMTES